MSQRDGGESSQLSASGSEHLPGIPSSNLSGTGPPSTPTRASNLGNIESGTTPLPPPSDYSNSTYQSKRTIKDVNDLLLLPIPTHFVDETYDKAFSEVSENAKAARKDILSIIEGPAKYIPREFTQMRENGMV